MQLWRSSVYGLHAVGHLVFAEVRAVPEIILGGMQTLFCPVGGGCFVDSVSEGWGSGE